MCESGRKGEGGVNSCSRPEDPERALISPGRGGIIEKNSLWIEHHEKVTE